MFNVQLNKITLNMFIKIICHIIVFRFKKVPIVVQNENH